MDANELKANALLERLSQLVPEYENKIADLRVIVTQQDALITELRKQVGDEDEKTEAE